MNKSQFLLCAVPFILAACAGTPINWSSARAVKIGMTQARLTETMGKPYMVTTRGADEIWVYSHANAFSGSESVSFIVREGAVSGVPTIPDAFR